MEVADDAWASMLPDILLDIFGRLESTAVIRCAGACKPWRRTIIGNAASLRPRPDRFNPNLLLGFFHYSWNEELTDVVISVTAVDTGHCQMLSSLIPAASAGGVNLSSSHSILSSRDGFLLLQLCRGSEYDDLCLCNPMAGDCRFLPQPSIGRERDCEYTLLTGYDPSTPGARTENAVVRILAKACMLDRVTYQVFSCGGDGAGIWGPVQHSEVEDKGLGMRVYGRNAVVGCNTVHWLTGPRISGRHVTCTFGLDIDTGRAWDTQLPSQCRFFYTKTDPCTLILTTSGNGRLSLLQPLQDRYIKVWVLNNAVQWTVQHKICVGAYPAIAILGSQYSNVVCPNSGFLFIVLKSSFQLCINLDSLAHMPVQWLGKQGQYKYYPYEMDWSTYIANMKIF